MYLSKSCPITINEFEHLYWNEEQSMEQIARDIGVFSATLRHHILANDLKIRTREQSTALLVEQGGFGRKYTVNQQFFDSWSPKMAWVLGLIASDGSVHKNGKQFYLASKDVSLINRFINLLAYDGPIRQNNTGVYVGQISSVVLVRKLVELGITPNKTATLAYPPVPESLHRHFIRGFFDGDGCLSLHAPDNYIPQLHMSIVTISERFATGLCAVLSSIGLNHSLQSRPPKGNRRRQWIIYAGAYDSIAFCEFMYQNVPESLCLSRKRAIFDAYAAEHRHKYVNGIAKRLPQNVVEQQPCDDPTCDRPARRKTGLCEMHYARLRRARKKALICHASAPGLASVGSAYVTPQLPKAKHTSFPAA